MSDMSLLTHGSMTKTVRHCLWGLPSGRGLYIDTELMLFSCFSDHGVPGEDLALVELDVMDRYRRTVYQ